MGHHDDGCVLCLQIVNRPDLVQPGCVYYCGIAFGAGIMTEADEEGDDDDATKYAGFPLVESMLRDESTRTASLRNEGAVQMQYPLSNAGFFTTLFMIRGRALDWMLWPWALVTLHAVVYTLVKELAFENSDQRENSAWEIFLSFVLNSTLSFLLVFRLNRAASRFWDARTMWGQIVASTRTLVSGLVVHGSHDLAHRDEALRWVAAFPIATMEFLRGCQELPLDHFAGVLSKEQVEVLQKQRHPPMYAADQARYNLKQLFDVHDNTSPSKSIACSQQLFNLEQQLNTIVGSGGGMERIKGTPLPVVYVSHLRTFLMFDLLLFPYVFGPSWRWSTIPIVALAAFVWLGIECAAIEVECPFRKDRVNSLNMDGYVMGLLSVMLQQITVDADQEIERRKEI